MGSDYQLQVNACSVCLDYTHYCPVGDVAYPLHIVVFCILLSVRFCVLLFKKCNISSDALITVTSD
jgi:hypothetical protein